MKEIEILVTLDHPNVIKLYEIWEYEDLCFLVMEYCEGGELFDYILRNRDMGEITAVKIMK